MYHYRTVGRNGQALDLMLFERRDKPAARHFFRCVQIGNHGVPDRIIIDKIGANLSGLETVNVVLKFTSTGQTIKVLQDKYLNNIFEQDHRFIKRLMGRMLGFKAFHSASATLDGIETAHLIRNGQFYANGLNAFQQR